MTLSNAEIVREVQKMDFDQRMIIADAICTRAFDLWPDVVT